MANFWLFRTCDNWCSCIDHSSSLWYNYYKLTTVIDIVAVFVCLPSPSMWPHHLITISSLSVFVCLPSLSMWPSFHHHFKCGCICLPAMPLHFMTFLFDNWCSVFDYFISQWYQFCKWLRVALVFYLLHLNAMWLILDSF